MWLTGKDTVGLILQLLSVGKGNSEIKGFVKNNIYYLNYGNDYQIKKFADKLKDIVCLLIGCTREQLEDREFKEKELGEEWWYYGAFQHGSHYDELKSIHVDKKDAEYILEYSVMNYVKLVKLSPRKLLQLLGTNCGRDVIHPNIWVNSLFADYNDKYRGMRIINMETKKVVAEYANDESHWIITDMRFPNELKAVKDRDGITIRVNRGIKCKECGVVDGHKLIPHKNQEHSSETALDDAEFDYVIDNNGTIEELIEKVKQLNLV